MADKIKELTIYKTIYEQFLKACADSMLSKPAEELNAVEPEQPKEPEQAKQAEPAEIDPGSVPDAAATPVQPVQPIQPAETREEAPRPRFHTPEGFEFNRYFLAERRIMLENVSYETGRLSPGQTQYKLNARDTIVAQVLGQAGVKVTYNRTLSFEPEAISAAAQTSAR